MDAILIPLIQLAIMGLQLYVYALIISAVLSWLVAFNVVNTQNKFVYSIGSFLHRITEPGLRKIRQFVPNFGGVDISPIILIMGIFFLQGVLTRLMFKI